MLQHMTSLLCVQMMHLTEFCVFSLFLLSFPIHLYALYICVCVCVFLQGNEIDTKSNGDTPAATSGAYVQSQEHQHLQQVSREGVPC